MNDLRRKRALAFLVLLCGPSIRREQHSGPVHRLKRQAAAARDAGKRIY